MQVEIFAICDAAADYGGRLSIMGTFEGIASAVEPIVRERCVIAARLRFQGDEAGSREVAVQIVGEDGQQPLPTLQTRMDVKMAPGRSSMAYNLVLNLNNISLPRFGAYEIRLLVDGECQKEIPLLVARAKPGSRMRNPMEN